jgi:Fuc2NAc and GlcNAc transferase
VTGLLTVLIAFAATYFGIELYRRWSLRSGTLALPNERSSHEKPTPTGAGIVIVIVSLAFLVVGSLSGTLHILPAYFAGAVAVAAVSWLDDRRGVSFVWRFLVHAVAAAGVAATADLSKFFAAGVPNIPLVGFVAMAAVFCWIVWLISVFNFMDGIDGLVGLLSVIAAAGWLVFADLAGSESVRTASILIFALTAAFLVHNWQPASVFMGDTGSTFLGFTFAVLPFIETQQTRNIGSWPLLFGVAAVWVPLFDMSFTSVRRTLARQPLWIPSREHLYQRLVIAGWTHSTVSIIYGVFATAITSSWIMAFSRGGSWYLLGVFITAASAAAGVLVVARKKIVDVSGLKC